MPEMQRTAFETYLKAFVRRKFAFGGVFLLALVGLGLLSLAVRPAYRTASRVAIADVKNMRTPDFLDVYLPGASTFALAGDTYVALIQGLPMADKISDRLSGEGIFISGKKVSRGMKAEFFEPDMIEISITNPDSLRAVALANAAAEVFVDANREQIRSQLSRAVDFIGGELKDARAEWLQAQQNLADFQTKESIPFVDSRLVDLAGRLNEFEKTRSYLETQIEADRAKEKETQDLLRGQSSTPLNPQEDPVLIGYQHRLVDVEIDLASARAEYSDDANEVKIKLAQRDELRAQIRQRVQDITSGGLPVQDDAYYKNLRSHLGDTVVDLVGLEAQAKGVDDAHRKTLEELSALPAKHLVYRELILQSTVAENKVGHLMEKLQEARIRVGGIQGNASVIDLAVDSQPTSSRVKLLLYAAVLSMILAVGAVFVLEYLDDTLKTAEEMSRDVRITPLAAIPFTKQLDKRLLAPGDQRSPLFECYRILRSGVRFASVNNPIRHLLVTSSLAGEGKSSTAVNLGVTMAAAGQRVLLVDADLRNPTIHRLMGIEPRVGLTSVLLGEATLEESILKTPYEHLMVLPCGPVPPNPVELFESRGLREVVEELRGYADLVIFDSAPVLPVTDSSLLAATLDAAVLVLASGEVTTDDAVNAKRVLENAGARVIGGVLNKVRHGTPDGYYGYGRYPNQEDGKRGTPALKSRLAQTVGELASRVTGRPE